MKNLFLLNLMFFACLVACEDANVKTNDQPEVEDMPLEEVAKIVSELDMDHEHLQEVFDAVTSSIDNGYDQEYMMKELFTSPGTGVGEDRLTKSNAPKHYEEPLKMLIEAYLKNKVQTKSSEQNDITVEDYINYLKSSDIQIYWPYSENWDGKEYPVITFNPDYVAEESVGYKLVGDKLEKLIVDESYARNHPVWVINRNEDSSYPTLEILRKENPDLGEGGNITIKPQSINEDEPLKTLVLRSFEMKRNYDTWLAGASEFLVKVGAVENFTATTEAELKLYVPTVTDFMVVVRRGDMGMPIPFNAVLVSEWTSQLEMIAFMIMEDDGGTRTSWKCSAVVKVSSKSYGMEIVIPINTSDDIVWRGQLSSRYLEETNNEVAHFGDVDLVFDIRTHR